MPPSDEGGVCVSRRRERVVGDDDSASRKSLTRNNQNDIFNVLEVNAMTIYNWFEDVGYLGWSIYLIFLMIALGLITYLLTTIIKSKKEKGKNKITENQIRIIILFALSIFVVALGNQFIKQTDNLYKYKSETYYETTGTFNNFSAVRDDYRNNIEYDISFCIDDMNFEDTNIICDKNLYETLMELDGENIKVIYYNENLIFEIQYTQ